jgi:competence protein ComEA
MLWSLVALVACLSIQASAQGAPSKSESHQARPTALVNLNSATASQLQELPGIGAKTAERIIEYRQKKGPFKKIEELMNVKGIGEKSFLKLRPQITVTGKPDSADQQ